MSERSSRLVVYIDGFCPYCRATGKLLERLDWRHKVEVVSFRHTSSYESLGINRTDLERKMHVGIQLNENSSQWKVRSGFDAVIEILKRISLLLPLLPVAMCLRSLGIGDSIYRWMADHRIIVPDASKCNKEACGLAKR